MPCRCNSTIIVFQCVPNIECRLEVSFKRNQNLTPTRFRRRRKRSRFSMERRYFEVCLSISKRGTGIAKPAKPFWSNSSAGAGGGFSFSCFNSYTPAKIQQWYLRRCKLALCLRFQTEKQYLRPPARRAPPRNPQAMLVATTLTAFFSLVSTKTTWAFAVEQNWMLKTKTVTTFKIDRFQYMLPPV